MRKHVFYYVAACLERQQFKYNNTLASNPMLMHVVNEP